MLVPGADRLALGEQPATASTEIREASQENNPPLDQGVPAWPGQDSVFATSEFAELLPGQVSGPETGVHSVKQPECGRS